MLRWRRWRQAALCHDLQPVRIPQSHNCSSIRKLLILLTETMALLEVPDRDEPPRRQAPSASRPDALDLVQARQPEARARTQRLPPQINSSATGYQTTMPLRIMLLRSAKQLACHKTSLRLNARSSRLPWR